MRTPLLCLLLVLAGMADAQAQRPVKVKKKGGERERLSPILDLLPAGSTIKDVRIPRFDKEKRRAALLRASVLKVVSEEQISGQNIELRVFSKEGPESLRMHMSAAEFSRRSGVLTAKELITVSGEKIKADGRDGLFHLDTRQGFVRGPVTTTFLRPDDEGEEKSGEEKQADDGDPPGDPEPEPMPVPLPLPETPLAEERPAFLEPQALTIAEREDLDLLLQSRSKSVLADRVPTRAFLTRSEQLSQSAEVSFRSFTNLVEKGLLLAPVSTDRRPDPAPTNPAEIASDEIKVTCEGGMYLDPEQGHISYLRNIEVVEARFTLTCSKALKVFFDPIKTRSTGPGQDEKREDDGAEGDSENGDARNEDATSDLPSNLDFDPGDFTQIKMIVASGGVRVLRHDPQGKRPPVIATAETAIVDVETGDIVLQGGSPSVSQGVNALRAEQAELYLRYYANGNLFAEKGRWVTVGDLSALKGFSGLEAREHKNKNEDGNGEETEEKSDPPAVAEDEPKESDAAPAENAGNAADRKSEIIMVKCSGGIYFDAKDGQVVYLEDVEVTDPRFRMRASDELKVHLRRRPNAEADELTGPEAFSDVSHVVASGKVSIVRNDPEGTRTPVTASAAHVIFDVQSTDIFLQGGSPTIRQGDNYLQAGAPHLYLRFYQNGSLYAEPGPWTTVGDLANLRPGPEETKKPPRTIKITCQKGLYFDSLKGHVVYLDRVVVQEARFAMNCRGSMRIHLQERENAKKDRLEGPEAFSDVNVIIATGGVTVVRKDPNGGLPITASAETATYEARTGDIGLRRGFPIIRRGNSYLKALEEGLEIAIYADGRFYAEKGKWETSVRDDDFESLRKK